MADLCVGQPHVSGLVFTEGCITFAPPSAALFDRYLYAVKTAHNYMQ